MYLLAVLSVVLAVVNADPLACCLPRRWSGLLQELGGAMTKNTSESHVTDDWLEIHYDYDQGKQAVVSHNRDEMTGVRGNTTVVYDYKESRMHIVTSDGVCHTDPLDPHGMFDPCMILNFQYGGSYTIGSSKKRFQINTWNGMLGSSRFGIAVTADQHCYPVADKLYGEDHKGAAVYAFLFLNISTTDVKDSMFAAPAGCRPTGISTGVGKRDLDALGLKRRPFDSQ